MSPAPAATSGRDSAAVTHALPRAALPLAASGRHLCPPTPLTPVAQPRVGAQCICLQLPRIRHTANYCPSPCCHRVVLHQRGAAPASCCPCACSCCLTTTVMQVWGTHALVEPMGFTARLQRERLRMAARKERACVQEFLKGARAQMRSRYICGKVKA